MIPAYRAAEELVQAQNPTLTCLNLHEDANLIFNVG